VNHARPPVATEFFNSLLDGCWVGLNEPVTIGSGTFRFAVLTLMSVGAPARPGVSADTAGGIEGTLGFIHVAPSLSRLNSEAV
jgi:hypothetical protein